MIHSIRSGSVEEKGSKVKPIKMLGLATLAALAALAFIGASSAMALHTQLCRADESLCSPGNVVSHLHEETLIKAKLLSSLGTIECNVLFIGDTLGLGQPLLAHGYYILTECIRGSEGCTATEVSSDALRIRLRTGHETGEETIEVEFKIRCGIFINCVYNGENLKGTVTGPLLSTFANGDVTFTEQTLNKVSGICPATGKLDISMMPLDGVYLSK